MSSALVFSSKSTAQSASITTAPEVIALAGNTAAGDLGAFSDRMVPYYYEGATDPGRADTFSVNIAPSSVAWYGLRGRQCTPELFGNVNSSAAQCIQEAVDYLYDGGYSSRNGGTIYLDARTYNLGTHVVGMRPGIQLVGRGRGSGTSGYVTRLETEITSGQPMITSADPTILNDNIVVEDIMFAATQGSATLIDAAGWGSSSVRRNGFYNAGAVTTPSGIGVYLRAGVIAKSITSALPTPGISKSNPAVVHAVGHGFSTGETIFIRDVAGMTQINGTWSKITVLTADTFGLDSIDSTGFSTYTSGGRAEHWIGDATYNVLEQNYFSGGSYGMLLEDDANSNNILYNRFQPQQNCQGLTLLSHFGGFPNNVNVVGNQFESSASGAIGVNCFSGADFAVLSMNRFELSGSGHIGINAAPGTGRIMSRDDYYDGSGSGSAFIVDPSGRVST